MSGIELVGLAASVLQIADLGWKSSYKLYAFSKKVHDAGKSIELVSQDIAATGAILRQLGQELKKDEESTPATRLGTEGLIVAASKLVDECQTLFKEIDQGIIGERGSKVILGFKQKLKWSYLEPRVDLLRTNLERLKSSLALMLNVLIYAEQSRSRQRASVLKEQQKLVASFAEQKADSEKRIADLKKRIEPAAPAPQLPKDEPPMQTTTAGPTPVRDRPIARFNAEPVKPTTRVASIQSTASSTIPAVTIAPPHQDASAAKFSQQKLPPNKNTSRSLPASESAEEREQHPEQHPELEHQRQLIDSILGEVNSSKYALDHGLRYRLHDGVLELHWREWEPLRATHGDQKLLAVLARSPLLARHWYEKAVKPKEIRVVEAEATLVHRSHSEAQAKGYGTYESRVLTSDEEEEEDIQAAKQEIRLIKQEDVASTRNALGSTELSWLSAPSSRGIALRRTLGGDAEKDDSNDEDGSHVSNTLRAYYNEKGRKLPEWLPADPKPAPTATTIPSQGGTPFDGLVASKRYGIAALWDEQVPAKQGKDEESDQSTNQKPVSIKPEDARSIRQASAVATKAEESRRSTLARLGAQSEHFHNPDRNLNLGNSHTSSAEDKVKELKQLNRSMFAVHVDNPLTAKERVEQRENKMMDRLLKRREQQSDRQNSFIDTKHSPKTDVPVTSNAQLPDGQKRIAERPKYQFEADSEDEEVEAEIDNNLDFLSGAAKKVNLLAMASGDEVETQNELIQRIAATSDRCFVQPSSADPAAFIADGFLKEWTTVKPIATVTAQAAFDGERLKRIR